MTVAHVPLNHWFYWVLMNISNEIEDLDVYMSLHPTNVYIYTELFCKGRENGILFVYKIPANLTVRKGHTIFLHFLVATIPVSASFAINLLLSKTHCFRVISLTITTLMPRF